MCSRSTSGYIDPAPINPKPPALLTALAYVHNPNHSCLDGIFYIKSFVITFIWQIRYCFMIFPLFEKPLIQFIDVNSIT
jgi:hypothetical protein